MRFGSPKKKPLAVEPNSSKVACLNFLNSAADNNRAVLGAFNFYNFKSVTGQTEDKCFSENNSEHIEEVYKVTPTIYNTQYDFDRTNRHLLYKEPNAKLKKNYNRGAICMVQASSRWAWDLIKTGEEADKDSFITFLDEKHTNSGLKPKYIEAYKEWRDDIVLAFNDLKASGVKTVIFRPFVEMTNKLFWTHYCDTEEEYAAFKNVWQQLHKYVEDKCDIEIIWCFAPQAAGGWSGTGDGGKEVGGKRFYPGDDYVDIIGLTLYSKGNASNTLNIKNELARWDYSGYFELGKPVGFSELGVVPVFKGDSTLSESGDFEDLLNNLKTATDKNGNSLIGNISFASLWTEDNGLFSEYNKGQEKFIHNDFFVRLNERFSFSN